MGVIWSPPRLFNDFDRDAPYFMASAEVLPESRLAQFSSPFTVAGMPLYLEGRSTAVLGRRLTVTREKPFIIRTKTTNHTGEVQIAFVDGNYQLNNQSPMSCRINGTIQKIATLLNHDEIEIGKDLFLVSLTPDTEKATQTEHVQVARVITPVTDIPSTPQTSERLMIDVDEDTTEALHTAMVSSLSLHQCAICDAKITSEKTASAWTDGERFLCRACLNKGVKPEHLPRKGIDNLVVNEESLVSDKLAVESIDQIDDITATPLDSSLLKRETRPVGEAKAELDSQLNETDSHSFVASPSESDRYRQSRRISASRLAAIDPAPPKGLLSKVSKVFSRKDDRVHRLESLEIQRKALLIEAGRLALGAGGSMGLPNQAIKTLLAGGEFNLKASDLLAADLDRWRGQRQQMVLLDAEIAALRRSMGLGQDPITYIDQAPPLRTDQKAQQERTFASMDGMSTDELSFTDEPTKTKDGSSKKSRSTAEIRTPGRRRR
jgi:hypothetical protein